MASNNKQRVIYYAAAALETAKQASETAHLLASDSAAELQTKEPEADNAELMLETFRREQLNVIPMAAPILPADARPDFATYLADVGGKLGNAEREAHELLKPLLHAAMLTAAHGQGPHCDASSWWGRTKLAFAFEGPGNKHVFIPEGLSAILTAVSPAPGSSPTSAQSSPGPAGALKRKALRINDAGDV